MKAYFQHFCRCKFIQRTFVYLFIFNAYFSRNLYGEIFGSKDGQKISMDLVLDLNLLSRNRFKLKFEFASGDVKLGFFPN